MDRENKLARVSMVFICAFCVILPWGCTNPDTKIACDMSEMIHACMEFTGTSWTTQDVEEYCKLGTIIAGCPSTDSFGRCTMNSREIDETIGYYYKESPYPQDGTPCTTGGGLWALL